jgi:hypothetical protein
VLTVRQKKANRRVLAALKRNEDPLEKDLREASEAVFQKAKRARCTPSSGTQLSSFLCGDGADTRAMAMSECYGPKHKMGMVVPHGGSCCANCAFGKSKKDGPHCLNPRWVDTPRAGGGGGGVSKLPVKDPLNYCCDVYQPAKPVSVKVKTKPPGKT